MGSGMRRAGPMARAARRQAAGPVHFRFAKARQAQAMEDSDNLGAIIKDSALGIFLAILGCFGLVSQAGRKKNKPAAAQSTPSAENSDINSNVFEKE